jgi:hypothetical protein
VSGFDATENDGKRVQVRCRSGAGQVVFHGLCLPHEASLHASRQTHECMHTAKVLIEGSESRVQAQRVGFGTSGFGVSGFGGSGFGGLGLRGSGLGVWVCHHLFMENLHHVVGGSE